ncbi:MAG: hypothetical protein CL678_16895 [Bdellovibrionaceae bacterium]|nr:hypothetical protein [Pseudobdellovibrionaceae bacterium]|tara:strand:- start:356 stop:775 length:420 start_codon:yes stop_codon:yes gene_type:complete
MKRLYLHLSICFALGFSVLNFFVPQSAHAKCASGYHLCCDQDNHCTCCKNIPSGFSGNGNRLFDANKKWELSSSNTFTSIDLSCEISVEGIDTDEKTWTDTLKFDIDAQSRVIHNLSSPYGGNIKSVVFIDTASGCIKE